MHGWPRWLGVIPGARPMTESRVYRGFLDSPLPWILKEVKLQFWLLSILRFWQRSDAARGLILCPLFVVPSPSDSVALVLLSGRLAKPCG